MENLPFYLPMAFLLTTGLAIWFLYRASRQSKAVALVISVWLTIQSLLALTLFYTNTHAMPPRFIFLILPPALLLLGLLLTQKGQQFLNKFDPAVLTLLHVVRLPVELVLLGLAVHEAVPFLMTFEGRNFDILSGLTAPFIYYFGFVKNQFPKTVLLLWNFICLGLLGNIVVHGVLSVPSPFQQFAFDQPNVALLYFPFNLLPAVVVPLVLFAHVVTIRQLVMRQPALPGRNPYQQTAEVKL